MLWHVVNQVVSRHLCNSLQLIDMAVQVSQDDDILSQGTRTLHCRHIKLQLCLVD